MPRRCERRLAGFAHVLRGCRRRRDCQVVVLDQLDAELGRQEHLVAPAGDRAADEPLVGVRPVHVGGVEEVAAELQRARDRRPRLALVGGAVERRHAHAAEADLRDLGAVAVQACAFSLHCSFRGRADNVEQRVFPLNLPNVLTVLRIMLVPVLVVALLGNTPAGDVLAAVVFALASLTDFVDGYLARARDSVTNFGKLMDPLADKLLIVAALISLVSLHRLRGVGGDGDHHARARGDGAAHGRHAGRRGDGGEHVRQGQDVPADRGDPRGDRRARTAAVGVCAALRRPSP